MTDVYQPPILTVDGVIFQIIDGKLNLLLIQRAMEPFKGEWALPGGYSAAGETTREAMGRVLKAKTGLSSDNLLVVEQLMAVDTVARDPRGHAVSIVYMGLGRNLKLEKLPTAQNPKFFSLTSLPKLAYDHSEIVETAVHRLRGLVRDTTVVFCLLPDEFTLTQLQSAYEAILGHELDKRNFRKRFLSYNSVEATDNYARDGAHRPAQLYRFKTAKLQPISSYFQ